MLVSPSNLIHPATQKGEISNEGSELRTYPPQEDLAVGIS